MQGGRPLSAPSPKLKQIVWLVSRADFTAIADSRPAIPLQVSLRRDMSSKDMGRMVDWILSLPISVSWYVIILTSL